MNFVYIIAKTLRGTDVTFKSQGNKVLCKSGRKILGFITANTDGTYTYAFGKPSQSCYAGFTVNSFKTAKSRMLELL